MKDTDRSKDYRNADTMPPSPLEQKAIAGWEQSVRDRGEWQTRLDTLAKLLGFK